MTAGPNTRIGCILLAAGGSTRLGRPKQLVTVSGKTLIRRVAETLCETEYSPAVAVLGSHASEAAAEIADLPVQTIVNDRWQRGMSTSITAGLRHLIGIEPDVLAVLITLCDQPLVKAADLAVFGEEFRRTHVPIIAAEYQGTTGVPALFSRDLFPRLLELTGDKGARTLIRGNPQTLRTVPLPDAALDIDGPADLSNLP